MRAAHVGQLEECHEVCKHERELRHAVLFNLLLKLLSDSSHSFEGLFLLRRTLLGIGGDCCALRHVQESTREPKSPC